MTYEINGKTYEHRLRRARFDRPINRDATILVLTEWYWNGELTHPFDARDVLQRHLTEDGWVEYSNYETYDVDRMYQVTGVDALVDERLNSRLRSFVRHMREEGIDMEDWIP